MSLSALFGQIFAGPGIERGKNHERKRKKGILHCNVQMLSPGTGNEDLPALYLQYRAFRAG